MATPVNNIEQKTDVVSSAVSNLLYQFKDLPNIEGLTRVFLDEVQELENEMFKLLTLRTLEEATGQQLDNIGQILGIRRTTSNDELYRNILKIRNIRQTSTGHANSVISLLRLFTGDPDISVYKGEGYFVDITFNSTCNPAAEDVSNLRTFLPVVTELRAIIKGDNLAFGFEGDTNALGFGSIHDATAGGEFGSLLASDI